MSLAKTLQSFWLPKDIIKEAERLEKVIEKISNLKPRAIPCRPDSLQAGFDNGQKDFRNQVLMLLHGEGYRPSMDGATVNLPGRSLTSGPLPVPEIDLVDLLSMREAEVSSLKSQVSWLKKIEDANRDLIFDLRAQLERAKGTVTEHGDMLKTISALQGANSNQLDLIHSLKKQRDAKDQTIQVWRERFAQAAAISKRLQNDLANIKKLTVVRDRYVQHERGQLDMWNRVQDAANLAVVPCNPCAEVSAWDEYASQVFKPYKAVVDQLNKTADKCKDECHRADVGHIGTWCQIHRHYWAIGVSKCPGYIPPAAAPEDNDLTLTVKVKVKMEFEDAC